MKSRSIDPEIVDEVYGGTLLAQWALAIAYLGLGIALLLLDVKETHQVRLTLGEETVNVSWPAVGFWLRAIGAGLVVGSLTIPLFQQYLGQLERPVLKRTVQEAPSQLTGALSYVANVGLMATLLGIAAGISSAVLLLADQLSRADTALRHFQFSRAVWLGAAATLFSCFAMLAFVHWRRQQYREVLTGKGRLRVTPLKGALVVRSVLLFLAIALAILLSVSFLPVLAGWVPGS